MNNLTINTQLYTLQPALPTSLALTWMSVSAASAASDNNTSAAAAAAAAAAADALYLYVGLANGVLIRSLVDVDAGSGK
jgi:hypothetical protein